MTEQEINREKIQLVRDLRKRAREGDDASTVAQAPPAVKVDSANGAIQKKKARWGPEPTPKKEEKEWDIVETDKSKESSRISIGGETPLGMVTPLTSIGGAWNEGEKAGRKNPRWDTGPVPGSETVGN